MAAHFGEMLLERRRAMGMSIQQVANVIKIRPQIIEFFETENLAAMPPRGYAQGMISSYARYLGLNPRVVVDAYFDALNAYERGQGGGSRYQEYVPDASPRSANATGRFMMLDGGPVSSRFAQRPPQAGYVSEGGSPHEPVTADRLRPLPAGSRVASRRTSSSGYGDPRATGRMPAQSGRSAEPNAGRRRSQTASADRGGAVRNRRPPASGGAGYSGRRDNLPPRGGSYGRNGHGGQVPPRRGSRSAAPSSIDPRLMIAGVAALALIVVLLAFLLLRGCAPKPAATDAGSAPKAQVADAADAKQDDSADSGDASSADTADADLDDTDTDAADTSDSIDDGSDAADGQAADGGGADAGDAAVQKEPEPIKVKVAIKEEDAVAFLEVKLDGKSVLGAQEVGPFEQEFTVTQQIEITTDKPSDVTVTKNGKKVRYDMKVSGVAKVTIAVPQPEPTDDGTTDGSDAADAANNASTGADGGAQQQ